MSKSEGFTPCITTAYISLRPKDSLAFDTFELSERIEGVENLRLTFLPTMSLFY